MPLKIALKCCNKLVSLFILTLCFILLIIGYIASLIIVKPREIAFLSPVVTDIVQEISPNSNFHAESFIVGWNKKELSFSIKAQDVKLNIPKKSEISIPEITIDISRSSLFLGRFKIDKLIIADAIINYKNSAPESDKNIESIRSEIYKSSKALSKRIKKIELSNSTISTKDKLITLNRFDYVSHRFKHQYSLMTDFEFELNKQKTSVQNLCLVKTAHDYNCEAKFANLTNDFLSFFITNELLKNSNFKANGSTNFRTGDIPNNIDLNINSSNGSINIPSKSIYIPFDTTNFYMESDEFLKNINLKTVNIEHNDTKLNVNGSIKRGLDENNFIINISGTNINKEEAAIFWPEKAAKKARKWVFDKMPKIYANDLQLFFSLTKKADIAKPILKDLKLDITFSDSDLNYSKLFPEITNAKGNLSIKNNSLRVDITEANADKMLLTNAIAKIDNLKIKPFNVTINSKINDQSDKIINYLFTKRKTEEEINKLNQLVTASNIKGDLHLNFKAIKKLPYEKINIKIENGSAKNVKFSNLFTKSDLNFSIEKKANSNNLITNIDCSKCNLKLPYIKYDKNKFQNLNFTFDSIKHTNHFEVSNFNIINPKASLSPKIIIDKKGLKKLQILNGGIDGSDINLDYNRDNNKKITYISNNTEFNGNLSHIFKSDNKQKEPTNININIKKLTINNQDFLSNFKIETFKNKNGTTRLGQAIFAEQNNFLYRFNQDNNLNSKMIFESDNLGYLLKNLNIFDQVSNGFVSIELEKIKDKNLEGNIQIGDFHSIKSKFFTKIAESKIFSTLTPELKKSEMIYFKKGKGNFTIKNDKLLIKEFATSGPLLGITAKGDIDFSKDKYHFNGVLVPAYSINNLLNIGSVPVIGDIITGGEGEGIISANYDFQGELKKDPKISINPLSAITPGFIRKIFSFLK